MSTGQKAALQVTRRGITMFEKLQIPVIGLIHNMSHIRCTKCSNQISMFGDHFSEFSKSISEFLFAKFIVHEGVNDIFLNLKFIFRCRNHR